MSVFDAPGTFGAEDRHVRRGRNKLNFAPLGILCVCMVLWFEAKGLFRLFRTSSARASKDYSVDRPEGHLPANPTMDKLNVHTALLGSFMPGRCVVRVPRGHLRLCLEAAGMSEL